MTNSKISVNRTTNTWQNDKLKIYIRLINQSDPNRSMEAFNESEYSILGK